MRCVLSTENFEVDSKPTLVTTQSVKWPATIWTVGVLFVGGVVVVVVVVQDIYLYRHLLWGPPCLFGYQRPIFCGVKTSATRS